MADQWPSGTPRDEVLARVATRGQRLLRLRRLAALGAVAAVGASAAVGVGVGRSGGIDLIAESTTVAANADASAPFSVCPGDAPMGSLHRNDRVFLTGRDDDTAWVELRSPSDPDARVWVQAVHVGADGDVSDLPVHDCSTEGEQLALPGQTTTTLPPTTVPGETTTTDGTTTTTPGQSTTSTTKPPTTTTTAAPDVTSPTIAGLAATYNEIRTKHAQCGGSPPTATPVEAIVSDAGGIDSVTLGWSFQSTNAGQLSGTKPMTLSSGKYRATFGPFPPTSMADDTSVIVTWTVKAVDEAGNQRTVAVGTAERITVRGDCFFG